MKNLLQTPSISFAESVRLALEVEGIPASVLDLSSAGFEGFAGRARVVILHDADWPRACEIVRRLQPPSSGPPPSWRWQKWGLLMLGLGFALMIAWISTLDPDEPRPAATLLFEAMLVAYSAGLALIFAGPIADRRRTRGP
jgi:putative signal transducing protein